jgi:hypothetical protein
LFVSAKVGWLEEIFKRLRRWVYLSMVYTIIPRIEEMLKIAKKLALGGMS